MVKRTKGADLYFGLFSSLYKIVWGISSTDRLLTLMKLAEIELFMLSVLFFARWGSKWNNRLKVVNRILCSRHELQDWSTWSHISSNTLGEQNKQKSSLLLCSWFATACCFLVWMASAGPTFFCISKVEENCRGPQPSLECQKSAVREMWAVHATRQVLSGDLMLPCASHDHSMSCLTALAGDCMGSVTSICGWEEQRCCGSLFIDVGVSEANAMAPLQFYNNAVEIKPYRVLLQMGLHFHKVSGLYTAFLNLTPFSKQNIQMVLKLHCEWRAL